MASEPAPVGDSATGRSSRSKPAESKVGNGNGNNGAATVIPWLLAGLGMLGAIGGVVGFVWGQINPKQDIGDVKKELVEQINQVDRRSRESDTELKRVIGERLTLSTHDEFVKRKDNDDRRQDESLQMLARTKINKEDEAKDMANINQRLDGIRAELTELRNNVTGSANVGKVLDHIQQEIDDLRKPPIAIKP